MKQHDDYDDHDDPGWFRDQLRQRDRELAELSVAQQNVSALFHR
jgi:hypothetical protein